MKWESSRPLDLPSSSPSHPLHGDSVLALPLTSPLLQPPPAPSSHVTLSRRAPYSASPTHGAPPRAPSRGASRAAHLAEVFVPTQRFASVPSLPLPHPPPPPSSSAASAGSASAPPSLLPFSSPCRTKLLGSPGPPAALITREPSAGFRDRLRRADSGASSDSEAPDSEAVAITRLGLREERGTVTWRNDEWLQSQIAVRSVREPGAEWGGSALSPALGAFEQRLDEAEEWLGAAMAALGARSRALAQAAAKLPQERWENARGRWQAKQQRGGKLVVPLVLGGTPGQRRLAGPGETAERRARGVAAEKEGRGAVEGKRVREGKVARVRGGVPEQLLCGAFAGIVSRTAVAPLDLIRTHLISSNGLPGAHKTAGSVLAAIMERDGWKGLFRGNGVNCLRVGPHKAVELCTFEMLKRVLCRPGHPLQHVAAPLSGGAAGLAGTLLTYPLELIRTRISVQPELYRDLGSAIQRIVQEEGAMALYRGIVPSLLGVVPYAATNYFVYDALRAAYRRATGRENVPTGPTLLFGAAAASASSAVTFPLEVVRRRLQLGVAYTAGPQTAMGILKGICEAEGPMAVYRGLGTTWLKLLPAAGISFVCYEAARVALRVDDASMAGVEEESGGESSKG